MSIRRACRVIKATRSNYHYQHRREPQAFLRRRIRQIAETRTRYGYRRIYVLLHFLVHFLVSEHFYRALL